MRLFLLPLILLIYSGSFGQCKTYKISSKGDTLNCTDLKGIKKGPWIVRMEALRGEPGYEEEGVFVNDKKEGTWKRFNLMGDLTAIENYRWGNKNGKCQYYSLQGIEREKSWKALNPGKQVDTIDVPDPKFPDKYEHVVVINEGNSLRHGTWKYYNPNFGTIVKIENYTLDQLQTGDLTLSNKVVVTDGIDSLNTKDAKPADKSKAKPKEVEEFEKKNKNKKKITVRDGKTG